jgi:hypothetical protein
MYVDAFLSTCMMDYVPNDMGYVDDLLHTSDLIIRLLMLMLMHCLFIIIQQA